MRTLDTTLKTDEDVKRIAEWLVPEAMEVFKQFTVLPRSNTELEAVFDDAIHHSMVAAEATYAWLCGRNSALAVILWNCPREKEALGLELARAYIDRLNSYFSILRDFELEDIRQRAAHEFRMPLPNEEDWYKRWFPRRDYCRDLYEILKNYESDYSALFQQLFQK